MKKTSEIELWRSAVNRVAEEFGALPHQVLRQVRELSGVVRDKKRAIHELTKSVEGEGICRRCSGECCRSGKYHFTVTDLLGYLCDGKPLFVPAFREGWCPYLGEQGCMMEAGYRPFNCVTFNCERIEDLLRPEEVQRFYDLEKQLRAHYVLMEKVFNNSFAHGLMANYEREWEKGGGNILRPDESCSGFGG